jgi:putative redox protein
MGSMTVNVRYLEGVRFEAEARGHQLVCDQPLDNGGADAGMTPPELMLASLGTCAGFYAAQYLRARNLSTAGLGVRVGAEKAKNPARLGEFHITVSLPEIEDRHREGVLRAVKSCLIHNTLLHAPQVEIELQNAATLADV